MPQLLERPPLATAIGLETIERLVEAICTAPSGDNIQPWALQWDRDARCLTVAVHPTRDRSVMNAGFRMARIACGAIVENLYQSLAHFGLAVSAERYLDPNSVALTLEPRSTPGDCSAALAAIRNRTTNRTVYLPGNLSAEQQQRLSGFAAESAAFPVRPRFYCEPGRKSALAETIATMDAVIFSLKEVRQALVEQLRFPQPGAAPVPDGLSVQSLELNALDRIAFRILHRYPEWAMRTLMYRTVRRYPLQRLHSAAGLCLLTTPKDLRHKDWQTGRMFQRAWLLLTSLGLAVQPMMSPIGLQSLFEFPRPSVQPQLTRWGGVELLDRLRSLAELHDPNLEICGILRFGFGREPHGRSGRRPLDQILTVV